MSVVETFCFYHQDVDQVTASVFCLVSFGRPLGDAVELDASRAFYEVK